MNKEQKQETINFLEKLKNDLLINTFKELSKGNKDIKSKIMLIKDINNQLYIENISKII